MFFFQVHIYGTDYLFRISPSTVSPDLRTRGILLSQLMCPAKHLQRVLFFSRVLFSSYHLGLPLLDCTPYLPAVHLVYSLIAVAQDRLFLHVVLFATCVCIDKFMCHLPCSPPVRALLALCRCQLPSPCFVSSCASTKCIVLCCAIPALASHVLTPAWRLRCSGLLLQAMTRLRWTPVSSGQQIQAHTNPRNRNGRRKESETRNKVFHTT